MPARRVLIDTITVPVTSAAGTHTHTLMLLKRTRAVADDAQDEAADPLQTAAQLLTSTMVVRNTPGGAHIDSCSAQLLVRLSDALGPRAKLKSADVHVRITTGRAYINGAQLLGRLSLSMILGSMAELGCAADVHNDRAQHAGQGAHRQH